jgi:hypothetical protein
VELADAKMEMDTLRKRNSLLENLNSTLKSELGKVQDFLNFLQSLAINIELCTALY